MKIGVIGLGSWGRRVFEEYARLRDEGVTDAVVGCDTDPGQLAAIDGADATYESLEETLEAADAVHVCTNNESHYPIAQRALRSDTDVLLEKPLTLDRRNAYHLVELASERGRILQSGHVFRFANVVRKVRDLYDDGYFGDVYYVTLRWTHQTEPIDGTDVLWDLLPHPLDILNFVARDWPDDAVVIGDACRRPDRLEFATASLEFEEFTAVVQLSWVDPVRRRQLEIVGAERSAVVECVDQTIDVAGTAPDPIDVVKNNTIRTEAQNFINAIETGQNTFNSAIVGARTVDVIDEIHTEVR
ncbi:hypothetical protein CV102_22690 [Natronococcus pandeyae]|uniref:Gfo/Idh/MocA family oxidoreductase n=1 Tax=Natronococcus pandeyae TaxID=2055836 RepID=A0A8J8Q0U6_9EURY|nr:Gfo/Idh/MocA family oxidoreductase [Natronococcus pandeyae]TYL36433.1 hypothetical protein CV102_22690 [Natronococcus pandeyae]